MRFVFWRVWFERCLHQFYYNRDPYVYWLTFLAVVTLVLTVLELVRCTRRYGLVVLLNIVFFASIVLNVATEITYRSAENVGHSPGPSEERLAEAILEVFPYALAWFYISFISLLLLLLSVVVGKIRKRPKRGQEA